MKVSIVIPTKNRRDLLAQTLASVRAQTHPHWEALVCDDGSDDGTQAMVAAMAAEDPRIQLIEPIGKPGAPTRRNQGVREAKGAYVVFLDSDDLLAPECLAGRVSIMEAEPELDAAIWASEIFDQHPGDLKRYWNVFTAEDDIERFIRHDAVWSTIGPIWRRDAIERIGGWDASFPTFDDWELHTRALIRGLRYRRIAAADHYVRRGHSERISAWDDGIEELLAKAKALSQIAAMLRERHAMTPQRRSALAGQMFEVARLCMCYGGWSCGSRVWRQCRRAGLVDTGRWIVAWGLLSALITGRGGGLMERWVLRHWPEYKRVGSPLHGKAREVTERMLPIDAGVEATST
jgi:GT2 family glycosyltransferase